MQQANNSTNNILPADKTQALNLLIRITQNMIHLAEKESQTLVQNDLLSFAIMQDEKALMAEHYVRVSEEFRTKINSYRGADKALLNRLEAAQKQLHEITSNNNIVVNGIYNRSRANTQSALLAAQEFGQARVRFEKTNDNTEETGQ